jgi:predicted amidohydrolase
VETSAFGVAALQLCATADKNENLARLEALAERAVTRGARLVVAPEVFLWRGPQAQEPEIAEPIPGPVPERLAALARRLAVHFVAGSFLERRGDGRPWNTSLLFAPDGSLLASYRKIHLFDVDIAGQVSVRESATRGAGTEPVVAPTDLGAIGLSICYDLRFPELYRRLALAGARILVVPAAFTFPTGAAHWEVLLRARAIENQCWVIAANQYGLGMGGVANYGNSMIIDPWGTVLARSGSDRDDVVCTEIDPAYLDRVREQLPALQHVRLADRGA